MVQVVISEMTWMRNDGWHPVKRIWLILVLERRVYGGLDLPSKNIFFVVSKDSKGNIWTNGKNEGSDMTGSSDDPPCSPPNWRDPFWGTWLTSYAPWVSGSPNQTSAEPHFLQILCAAFSSSAHLADWYYVMIMRGLWHQARSFSQ